MNEQNPIDFAKKYLEDLLSFFGLNTDVRATQDEDVIELSVPSTHLNGFLIGQHGDTLRSLQFLISTALRNNEFDTVRVNVDVADYKRHRNERLARQVETWISKIKSSGEPMELRPMNASDRRVVHRTVGEDPAVSSLSEGEGRDRRVVISPTKPIESDEEDVEENTEETEPAEPTATKSSSDTEEIEPAKPTATKSSSDTKETEPEDKDSTK